MTDISPFDVAANRAAQKWRSSTQLARLAWAAVWPIFALSPRPFWGWRRGLLRLFGAQVGSGTRIPPSARLTMPWNLAIGADVGIGAQVTLYALGSISIGDRTTISQNAHLCAGSHDWRDRAMPLTRPPITIGPNVWVCADAFVGPGVTIGQGAILAARGVAFRDLPAGAIAKGNPARIVRDRVGS